MDYLQTNRTLKLNLRLAIFTFLAVSIAAPAFAQNPGADTYKAQCAMCHGADGTGDTPAGKAMKARSLKEPDLVKASDAELIAFIKKGKGNMPAYADSLKDDQIKDVVAYIRTLQKK